MRAAPAESERINVTAMGGGTGLSTLLRGLKHYTIDPTVPVEDEFKPIKQLSAIVTVTDDGGSSGRLRDELGVPPPGDIRNCMTALSDDEALMSRLFQFRFGGGGDLEGHNFGNLFLTALTQITGDFAQAVELSSVILKTRGDIFPSTNSNVRLDALMNDGTRVRGETKISASKKRIVRLQLVPANARPLPAAIEAIRHADLITIGPGSLFTSVIPNLLVRDISKALIESSAVKVYVCNLMTQANESIDLSASEHIKAIFEHAGAPIFDYVVVNDRPVPENMRFAYAAEGATQIVVDHDRIAALGVTPICGDYLDTTGPARHNHQRLAQDLLALYLRARLSQLSR
ncbi:MAG TPA: gluconeogenesis factor YvcK family protein [candidate division Zixibacteria bacterium]|nr:gluconeogenesis factor YvcK family protein [candidate division Zixibacteria bacterium]